MAFELDLSLARELAPLAWLVGRWQGTGTVSYPTMESARFAQEIDCHHDGRAFLSWASRTWLLDAHDRRVKPLAQETGFWRLPGPQHDVDADGGPEVELLLAHPTGVVEMYHGIAATAKVHLRTDAVVRSPTATEYTAATRLYGYVNSRLMWTMDMAAAGESLTSHVSAELDRRD